MQNLKHSCYEILNFTHTKHNRTNEKSQVDKHEVVSKILGENHVKSNTKTFQKVTNLKKNDDPFYSKNAQLENCEFAFFHSGFCVPQCFFLHTDTSYIQLAAFKDFSNNIKITQNYKIIENLYLVKRVTATY